MEKATEEMRAYYQKRAGIYDASTGYEDPATIAELHPVIAKLRELLSERKVLEIACGPCFWTQQVSSATRSILATDYSESTLVEACKKLLDWNKVSLQAVDWRSLKFTDSKPAPG